MIDVSSFDAEDARYCLPVEPAGFNPFAKRALLRRWTTSTAPVTV
jgi:hypothetical protein